MNISSSSLTTVMQAVRQPREPLTRVRIRDGCLEFAAVDEANSVLCEVRFPLTGEEADSPEFAVDRRSLKRLAVQADDSVQICFDEEMIAFRASGHVYSSLTDAEELDLCPIPVPDPAITMTTTCDQLWDLIGRVGSSCVAFSGEDGAMWLAGKKGQGSLSGETVRVPSESATVPIECVSLISNKLLRRVLRQNPDDAELTVVAGHDVPVVFEWGDDIECRQAIAPRIQDGNQSSWDVIAEVSH